MREYALARMLTQPIPAWVIFAPLLFFGLRELLLHHREASRPDHSAHLLDAHKQLIESHNSSIATIADLAKGGEHEH